ncbi:ferritin-like domain-containing protein [Rhizobium jaguaris]|uniref:Ferritin-like domain-containing protein n=1 Tax=Rhizobium jaguaris TaxID=1312183 RepID=A0A387FR44_9HYPH|nr:ferritin-like domain-containing protein [Rhizobium jaguaris]AYG57732.1 ferritin-like domain-containing protein [Rhizobium jaguaris]
MGKKTLEDLFYDTLKDIYYAEKQIIRMLPKMAREAQSPDLKAGFEKHLQETEGHVERLQQVFELIGKRAHGKTCEAIQGMIAEGQEIIDDFKGTPVLDAGLISAVQAVEHYEIARYGSLRTWAETLGQKQVVQLLDQTLQEAGKTDRTLSKLAMTAANRKAAA